MRILVVEDSPTAALDLRRKLQALGHEVVVLTNGLEAWKHLNERHESLIITDWMMPVMDGLQLCNNIRTMKPVPYSYLILLTVKDLRKDVLQGLKSGADDFLSKPVDAIELAAALDSAERILREMKRLQDRVAELEVAAGLRTAVPEPAPAVPEPAPVTHQVGIPVMRWN